MLCPYPLLIVCSGGGGRTGTALACLALLDGVSAAEAVGYVRQGCNPRAVETPSGFGFPPAPARRV